MRFSSIASYKDKRTFFVLFIREFYVLFILKHFFSKETIVVLKEKWPH